MTPQQTSDPAWPTAAPGARTARWTLRVRLARPTRTARWPPSPRVVRRAPLVVLTLLGLGACGPSGNSNHSQPTPVAVVHLIDAIGADTLRRPFDPTDIEGIIARDTEPLLLVPAEELADAVWAGGDQLRTVFGDMADSPGKHELSGTEANKSLLLSGPLMLARSLVLNDPGQLLVRIKSHGPATLGLIVTRQGQQPPELTDLGQLNALAQSEGLALMPGSAGSSPWLQTVLPADATRNGLVLIVISRDRPTEIGALEVRSASPLAADLLEGRLRPTTQHLQLDGEAREGFVLPDGGSAVWALELPPSAARLTLDLAALGRPGPATLVYRLQSAGRSIASARLPVPHPPGARPSPWQPATIDLPPAPGKASTLTLLAQVPGGALIIGRPTITLREARSAAARADVIIVSLDTFRADRIDPGIAATPRLQQLARESLKFTDASSTSAWTLPAHTSLFTGRWSQTHGVTDRYHKLSSDDTLASAFRDAGYETAAITGGGYVSATFGLAAGFERYDSNDPCLFAIDPATKQPIQPHGSRQALLNLLAGPRDRPLFAFVHTFAAHHGLPADAELERIGMAGADFRRIRAEVWRLLGEQHRGSDLPAISEQLIEDVNRVYDASAMAADDLVGDIVDTLKAADRWEQTVLVVTSDHGQELFERSTVGHGHQLHPELLRIPLLIRAPGSRHGLEDTPVSLVDIGPTVRELAGLAPDPGAQGRSLVPLLSGASLPPEPLLAHLARIAKPATHVYRKGSLALHLTEDAAGVPRPSALYDLASDPGERSDLLGQRRALGDQLTGEFLELLREIRHGAEQDTEAVQLDDNTRRQLEELGYVTGN